MNSKLFLTPIKDGRLVLPSLLIGQLGCAVLIWFAHNPGLQLWVALPIINGFVTFWLMSGNHIHCASDGFQQSRLGGEKVCVIGSNCAWPSTKE